MARWDGLVCDWVTGIEVAVKKSATSPAELIYVSEDSADENERNLFWAHRGFYDQIEAFSRSSDPNILTGGGGGNFGIITKYYFRELAEAPTGAVQTTFQFDWATLTAARYYKISIRQNI